MSRILVAEDDPRQLELRKLLLESIGHEVTTAIDIREAMLELERAGVDLLIMDLGFPAATDGLDLIRQLRAEGYQAPVIVLSGWPEALYGSPEEKMISRVLVKPVPTHELLQAIHELVPPHSSRN